MKMAYKNVGYAGLMFVAINPSIAHAVDWSVQGANVVLVESTYMPTSVVFKVDKAAGSCPAGSFLQYWPQGANADEKRSNIEAAFSLLLSAKISGDTIAFCGYNSGCSVTCLMAL